MINRNEVENPLLKGLNENQKLAVTTIKGTTRINACAGSGKTRVLVNRVAFMIESGIKPREILMTTFTKKASEEMKERLSKLIPASTLNDITIGTSHSIGYRILREEYKNMNHPMYRGFSNALLINYEQKKFGGEIRKSLMKDRTIDKEVKDELEKIGLTGLLSVVGFYKNKGFDDDMFLRNTAPTDRNLAYYEFFREYEYQKQVQKRLDMDDMLVLFVKLLKENEVVLKKYQKQFKYLLVDEAQDNNLMQYELIKLLGYPEYNVFVVGDDSQSMYSFRGAEPDQFINFTKTYKNVKEISLVINYRSKSHILECANKLIKNNVNRIDNQMIPFIVSDDKAITYHHFIDEMDESQFVAEEINILHEKENKEYKKIAVLFRTNKQSLAIENALICQGIPYVLYGGVSFYDRKEVKDIISYLQLVHDKDNNKAFERVINVPSRFLGKAYIEKLKTVKKTSLWDANSKVQLKNYEEKGVMEFKNLVNSMKNLLTRGESMTGIINHLLDKGYRDYLLDDENEESDSRMENIETLKYLLSHFENVETFLNYVDEMTSKAKHNINGVQLMTIHKSKGLEFDTVFGIGLSENLLPHFKSIEKATEQEENGEKPQAIEEERRLAYVLVTRAEQRCFVSSTETYNGKSAGASRFISEMGLMTEFEADSQMSDKENEALTDIMNDHNNIYK
jgi:DNA helicase-2/ATP-dependent DNA helicase PcrA